MDGKLLFFVFFFIRNERSSEMKDAAMPIEMLPCYCHYFCIFVFSSTI